VTTQEIRRTQPAVPSVAVRARDILASEWTKLRSVRSTYWTLLIAAVVAIGGSVLAGYAIAGAGKPPGDPLAFSFISWAEYPVLAVGVLGVLAFSTEHTTGLIAVTFTAVPQRRAVLAAKAAVAGAVTLIFGELLAFASFLITQAILSGHHLGLSLSRPGVLGAVLAAGFCLFVVAMLGLGLGVIIRYTVGAVLALPAVLYLPLITAILPSPWNQRIGRFTLFDAAHQVVALHPATDLFSPALSMLVLIAWPAAALLAAALLITRRDI
jgi:ABC-type transport system involved in multi-copper enzyme maturation permease subunit